MINGLNKEVFVTGATGFVGKNLTKALAEAGYQVHVLTGDINDPITLPPGISTIFHCAGVIYDVEKLERVNVEGTKNIVKVALQNNCKLIHLSSAGAINPKNTYEISKWKSEQVVQEGIKQGLIAQILRPTTIFGIEASKEGNGFFELIKRMRNGSYKNIGNGVYNIVHVDEVVRAMILLSEAAIGSGGIYLVNNPITFRNIDKLVKSSPPPIMKKTTDIPYAMAWFVALGLTILCPIVGRKNPLSFSRLRALTNTQSYSQNKIVEEVHFKNAKSIQEYIKSVCLNIFV